MIKNAVQNLELKRGNHIRIIEPTSGNTGIALAGIGKALNYEVEVIVPVAISQETKDLILALGAKIVETPDDLCPRVGKGTDQAISMAQAMIKSHPDKYFMPNQYENESNYLAHYETTGPEIWNQTHGKITHFIAGIGTGGTITGVGTYLKEGNSKIKIIAVEPEKGHHLQGLRNLEESSMPKLLEKRADIVDEWIRVSDNDAFETVRQIALKEKMLVGPSSGATMYAAMQISKKEKYGLGVVIFGDSGKKYHSLYKTKFSSNELKRFQKLLAS